MTAVIGRTSAQTKSGGTKTEANALQTASPHTPLSSFGSQGPSLTPTTGERISTRLAEAQESVHALYTLFGHLQELDAGKYVERLERQRHALALGEEFKKKHIVALVAERDDLREKLRKCVLRCCFFVVLFFGCMGETD